MVRYRLKPSIGTKSHEPKWSSTRHKVIGNPTNNTYVIPSINKSKVWLRHELLKVQLVRISLAHDDNKLRAW